jgi:hypothetical protein
MTAPITTVEALVAFADSAMFLAEPITCAEREAIVRERGYYYPDERPGGLTVHSSLTDHYGQYGLPKVFTEWGTYEGEPVLRDVRHPAEDLGHNLDAKDRLPCEHYVAEGQA